MSTSELYQLIFSGVVAFSTVIYSILTWKLVSETRKTREFQTTPDINIYFERAEADASFTYIVFANSGLGYAKNVKFEILSDFKYYDDETCELATKGIFTAGLDSFYSNQFHKFFFTDLSQNHEEKMSDTLEIKVTFFDLHNKRYSKNIKLSLLELSGISILTPPDNYLGRVAHEMREIKKLLKNKFEA